jgi:hypothetical protein
MQVEVGILSSKVKYKIKDINGKEIKYIEKMKKVYGKYIGVIELQEDNDILLEFCREKGVVINHEASLNYIFKVKSNTTNSFTNYKLPNSQIEYVFDYNKEKSNLELEIPKILNKEGTKAVPTTYNIRIYPEDSFEKDEDINTISFISYYPFSTYIYKILGNEKDGNKDNIKIKIENYPEDKPYLISVIGVTNEEEKEEIFAYNIINDPYMEPDNDDENSYTVFLIIAIIVFVILLCIFTVVIYRMIKQKKYLETEILRISRISSISSSSGQNKDPTTEPFIKEEGL